MSSRPIGYQHLIERHGLPARPLDISTRTDTAVKGREVQSQGNREIQVFEPAYIPEESLSGHLQFALRYEGINLEVLSLLFQRTGAEELRSWLAEKPESKYARRAGFLYEWLTHKRLEVKVPAKTRYVAALDTDLQFGPENGPRNEKFRVMDNLPGNPDFCPMVRRTGFLEKMIAADFRRKIHETINRYDPDLLRRAAAFLYLKETQSSFEVEREKPSADRAQRFADLLRQADTRHPLSEQRLSELQNAVVDPRFHESTWRNRQNWLGRDLGYRRHVDFVPPRPEDVPSLMAGLLKLAGSSWNWNPESSGGKGMDPVVYAAAVAFGFVFIHPFMDGNGRIHRFLIHEMLAKTGFTPPGMVLPVSAVILANLNEYVEALEAFSRPLLLKTSYDPALPDIPASGNDVLYFRYFDCTAQAEFLYRALERTVQEDLQKEIDFLIGFDRARKSLNAILDWPNRSLDLFIRCVHQNEGRLSKVKREAHFGWMTEAEVTTAENLAAKAFEPVLFPENDRQP